MSRVDAWEKPCKDDDADDKAPSARSVDALPASAKDEISRGAGEAGLSGLSSKRPPADAKGQPPAARAERKWPSETVRPDGKRDREYWEGTNGLLKLATAHLYRKIVAPREEGGFRDFFDQNAGVFDSADEHKLEYMALYREYEKMVDAALDEFAKEHCGDGDGKIKLHSAIRDAVEAERPDTAAPKSPKGGVEKSVDMLLAAADYKKFVRLMRQRAAEQRKREAAALVQYGGL